jgi:hypothetical protein
MTKTITYDDYLRLIGLLTIAQDHRTMLSAIEHSACALLGVDSESGGHVSDCIWGENYSPSELLRRLGIPAPTPPASSSPPAEVDRQMANVKQFIGRARETFPEE